MESKDDPETEPYRSKYRARELLREVRALLGAEEESGERQDDGAQDEDTQGILAARRAVIEFRLGVNHTETEEMSAGEEHLVKGTRFLEKHRLSHDCVSTYIQAQNNLGILWAERGEIMIGQRYLESAESLYCQYMKKIGKPPVDPDEHFTPEEQKLTDQERSKRFERVYTHTMYYLAQVYKHLKQDEKAAQYCHTTLQRQLEYDGYNPVEWGNQCSHFITVLSGKAMLHGIQALSCCCKCYL
ncbi:unnamed protein product [Staurois parvus]|uniref:KIF-binding protein n=1 Tax=Staurois parvus TaxID=386267 RepID=A0ABN9BJP5_9NEOB|nr:unnamed protein product [Staurois parvus]